MDLTSKFIFSIISSISLYALGFCFRFGISLITRRSPYKSDKFLAIITLSFSIPLIIIFIILTCGLLFESFSIFYLPYFAILIVLGFMETLIRLMKKEEREMSEIEED